MLQNVIQMAFNSMKTVQEGVELLESFTLLAKCDAIRRTVLLMTSNVYQMFLDVCHLHVQWNPPFSHIEFLIPRRNELSSHASSQPILPAFIVGPLLGQEGVRHAQAGPPVAAILPAVFGGSDVGTKSPGPGSRPKGVLVFSPFLHHHFILLRAFLGPLKSTGNCVCF